MPEPPFPKNAPGPFYVEKDCCIGCEAPYHEAPDLMAHDEGDYAHCYFKKQPETRRRSSGLLGLFHLVLWVGSICRR